MSFIHPGLSYEIFRREISKLTTGPPYPPASGLSVFDFLNQIIDKYPASIGVTVPKNIINNPNPTFIADDYPVIIYYSVVSRTEHHGITSSTGKLKPSATYLDLTDINIDAYGTVDVFNTGAVHYKHRIFSSGDESWMLLSTAMKIYKFEEIDPGGLVAVFESTNYGLFVDKNLKLYELEPSVSSSPQETDVTLPEWFILVFARKPTTNNMIQLWILDTQLNILHSKEYEEYSAAGSTFLYYFKFKDPKARASFMYDWEVLGAYGYTFSATL